MRNIICKLFVVFSAINLFAQQSNFNSFNQHTLFETSVNSNGLNNKAEFENFLSNNFVLTTNETFPIDYEFYDAAAAIDSNSVKTFIWRIHSDFEPQDYIYLTNADGIVDSSTVKFKNAIVSFKWLNDSYNFLAEDSTTLPFVNPLSIDFIFYDYSWQNTSGLSQSLVTKIVEVDSAGFPLVNQIIWQDVETINPSINDTALLTPENFTAVRFVPVNISLNAGQRFAVIVECQGGDKVNDPFYVAASYVEECGSNFSAKRSKFWPNSYYNIQSAQDSVAGIFPTMDNLALGFNFDNDTIYGENEVCEAYPIQNWSIRAVVTSQIPFFANIESSTNFLCANDVANEGVIVSACAKFGVEPYAYNWSSSNATGSFTVVSDSSIIAHPVENTFYFCEIIDANGDTIFLEQEIVVNDLSVDLGGDQSLNCSDSILLVPAITNSNGNTINYLWSNGSNSSQINVPSGNYAVTIADNQCSASDSVNLFLNSSLTSEFSAENTTANTVVFTNTSVDAVSFIWDFGDGNISYEENPTHTFANGGRQTVTLTSFNGNCLVNSFQTINVGYSNLQEAANFKIKLLPNPTNGMVHISLVDFSATNLYFNFYDLNGKLVHPKLISKSNNAATFDLSNLSEGIYLLAFEHKANIFTKKIILRKG